MYSRQSFKKVSVNLAKGFIKNVLFISAFVLVLFTSCSKETSDEQNIKPVKPSSARIDNAQGVDHGYFYTIYSEAGIVDMTFAGASSYAGNFSIDYSNVNDVVGGKGWNPGSSTRVINYNVGVLSGSYDFVGVYGWTTNPLIEYYICEKGNIPASTTVNTVSANGHTYTFRKNKRINAPNVTGGNGDFWQYIDSWGGQTFNGNKSINMANHVNNWISTGGQGFGTHYYQVFALEAFGNKSGSINATVW